MSTKRKAAPFTLHAPQHCTQLEFLEVLRATCPPECEFEVIPAKPSWLGICVKMKLGAYSFIGEAGMTTRASALLMAENFHKAVTDTAAAM